MRSSSHLFADGRSSPGALSLDERGVVRTLLYYHIFSFPLTPEEVFRLSPRRWQSPQALEPVLESLQSRGLVQRLEDYVVVGEPGEVEKRRVAERHAAEVWPRAESRGRFIARFPWVRAVAISGTLSKGVFHPGDDADFFVITQPGRLWLTRALLMGFKKTVLFNSRQLFCVNYLVDCHCLEVPDHNEFTAAEIAWLRPVSGRQLLVEFARANDWTETFLPNWRCGVSGGEDHARQAWAARILEHTFANRLGDRLDAAAHRVFDWHNRRRYARRLSHRFEQTMRATSGQSKHHPRDFQRRVLDRHQELVASFEAAHGLSLALEAAP